MPSAQTSEVFFINNLLPDDQFLLVPARQRKAGGYPEQSL